MTFLTTVWGVVLSHVLAFAIGAWIGRPALEYVRGFLPWNKG